MEEMRNNYILVVMFEMNRPLEDFNPVLGGYGFLRNVGNHVQEGLHGGVTTVVCCCDQKNLHLGPLLYSQVPLNVL
jgi:hypothetical protein